MGNFPKVSISPNYRPILSKLIHLKTTSFDFPTVNLVSYSKNIIQHHQMHNNWLKFEWDKKLSFFCDAQLTTLLPEEAVLSAENSGKPFGRSGLCPEPVMWSETVGLRTRPVWDQNRSWSSTLWSWSWSWPCLSGVVLWNTVLSRSSS